MSDKFGIKNIEKFSRHCYYICLGIIFLIALFLIFIHYFHLDLLKIFPPCPFYETTHYYCFGCGGTRAVNAILHGHFIKSFLYHPFVIYATVVVCFFMISHTLSIITKNRVKAMIFNPGYFYFGAAMIIIQCIIKNIIILNNGSIY